MYLIINNHKITTPIKEIILEVRRLSHNEYFRDIIDRGNYISVTCPWHSEGKEKHPSCSIFTSNDDEKIVAGTTNCFTCHQKANLVNVICHCLGWSREATEEWLIDNYSDVFIDEREYLPEIEINTKPKINYLDESILDKYNYFHPYIAQRKISEPIRRKFKIGYDSEARMMTMPVWDDKGNLLFISKRSVIGKTFHLEAGQDKPVYGLNFIKEANITEAIVVEGQIDALVAWSYGIPAVALFGSGTTDKQMELLNKSCINHFILMYDNDYAGLHGAERFKLLVKDYKLYTEVKMPVNKDVADCSREELFKILENNSINIEKYL